MTRPTYHEMASSWESFQRSNDPLLGLSEFEYNWLNYEQRVAYLIDGWGPEDEWENDEDIILPDP